MRPQTINTRQFLAFKKTLFLLKAKFERSKESFSEVNFYMLPNKRHANKQIAKYSRWIKALDQVSDLEVRDRH